MARRFYGTPQAAIGRQFDTNNRMTFQIVGVVGDVHDRTLREPIGPMAYATYAHAPTGRGQMTLLVRYDGSASAIVPAIRDYARAMDPAMPLLDVEVLSSRVDAATQQERLAASLSALFGVLALFLAAVGLYGVMTYAVARRQAEFGVRLALGASPRILGTMILSETLLVVGTGIIAGLAAAILCARLVTHMLFGLPALDPLSFAIACVTLLVVGPAVAYLPARRASRVDPLVILRSE
jgi:ABC-type antimicrobial peptide transport system permease subunit